MKQVCLTADRPVKARVAKEDCPRVDSPPKADPPLAENSSTHARRKMPQRRFERRTRGLGNQPGFSTLIAMCFYVLI